LENPSTYLKLPQSALSEAEFLAEVVLRTGCGILLDLNNLFVSASNHGSNAGQVLQHFLEVISPQTIGEIHLSGHRIDTSSGNTLRIDDHGSRVSPAVWDLYARTLQELGPIPTLIEWDTAIPPFETLQEEACAAQALIDESSSTERHSAAAC
jgi:uncharacterized protein (UPF0276 family)